MQGANEIRPSAARITKKVNHGMRAERYSRPSSAWSGEKTSLPRVRLRLAPRKWRKIAQNSRP